MANVGYSLSEWLMELRKISNEINRNIEQAIEEDNLKIERMEDLRYRINFPIDSFEYFPGKYFFTNPEVEKWFTAHTMTGEYSVRAQPLQECIHELKRDRRHGVGREEARQFVQSLADDLPKYQIGLRERYVGRRCGTLVVTPTGLYVEIADGPLHARLTQGWGTAGVDLRSLFLPISEGRVDLSTLNEVDRGLLARVIQAITVRDKHFPYERIGKLIRGYFEFVDYDPPIGLSFIDFNTSDLFTKLKHVAPPSQFKISNDEILVCGVTASPGVAWGRVAVRLEPDQPIAEGDILVCEMTNPSFVPLMHRAAAIVTDTGGLLCHAAIIARELKKPCIVGTQRATKVLQDGDFVEVDAEKGTVQRL